MISKRIKVKAERELYEKKFGNIVSGDNDSFHHALQDATERQQIVSRQQQNRGELKGRHYSFGTSFYTGTPFEVIQETKWPVYEG